MSLAFPNRSRNYDSSGRRIRFSGYDNMFEIRFFIEIDALAKAFRGNMTGESDYLAAFDATRDEIVRAAHRIYGRVKGAKAYTLKATDF